MENEDQDVIDFVNNNFYVDDVSISCGNVDIDVGLMKRTQDALQKEVRIRLHKIVSNSKGVLKKFHAKDLDYNLKDLDLGSDELPMQRSLGLSWNIASDTIKF